MGGQAVGGGQRQVGQGGRVKGRGYWGPWLGGCKGESLR